MSDVQNLGARGCALALWKALEDSFFPPSVEGAVEREMAAEVVRHCKEIVPLPTSRISPTGMPMDMLAPSIWHATCFLLTQYILSRRSHESFGPDGSLFKTFYGNRPVYRGQTMPWNIIPTGWREGVDQKLAEYQREAFMHAVRSVMGPGDALEFDLFGRIQSRREADGLARHYDIPSNLVDFTFDPRIALFFATGKNDGPPFQTDLPRAEDCAVVYFTSFVKLCATGNPKLTFPPVQSERLYRQAGLFVDFENRPEVVPDVLGFESPWMWVQQNCGRLFFPRTYPETPEHTELSFFFGDPMHPDPYFQELVEAIREISPKLIHTHAADAAGILSTIKLRNRPPWRVEGLDPFFVYTDDELVSIVKYIEYYLKTAALVNVNGRDCLDPVVVAKLKEFDSSALAAINTVAELDSCNGRLDGIRALIQEALS